MSDFIFSKAAEKDTLVLWEYIAEDDIEAADRVAEAIQEAIGKLVLMPGMGHRCTDLADETLRLWPIFSYLIIYRPETVPLEVVRVVSGYRDLAALLIGH